MPNNTRAISIQIRTKLSCLVASDLESVRDAATFLRQFLRWSGESLFHARKSNGEGGLERVYVRAGVAVVP